MKEGFVARLTVRIFLPDGGIVSAWLTAATTPARNPNPNPEACLVGVPWGRRAWKGSTSSCYADLREMQSWCSLTAQWFSHLSSHHCIVADNLRQGEQILTFHGLHQYLHSMDCSS